MKRLLTWALATIGAILVMTLCFGCAQSPSAPALTGFLFAFRQNVSDSQVEYAERAFDFEASCVPWRGHLYAPIPVKVYEGPFFCGSVFANGCTQGWGIEVNRKTFEGALRHELIHWFQQDDGYPPDSSHKGDVWKRCDGDYF